MKLRLKRIDVYYAEDILLDVLHGLPVGDLEGDPRLARILDLIQDAVYTHDIFQEG